MDQHTDCTELERMTPGAMLKACPWCVEEGSVPVPIREYSAALCPRHLRRLRAEIETRRQHEAWAAGWREYISRCRANNPTGQIVR